MLAKLVKPLGYALTLHGSMVRDLDLVAIPWADDAVEPELVVTTIVNAVDGLTGWDTQPGVEMPHGRRGWLIWFKSSSNGPADNHPNIDLSIMPRQNN